MSKKVSLAHGHQDPLAELNSLKVLLADKTWGSLLCSHRGLVVNGRQEIAGKLANYQALRDKVVELEKGGATNIDEIAEKLLGKYAFLELFSSGHFSRRRLIAGLSDTMRDSVDKEYTEFNK